VEPSTNPPARLLFVLVGHPIEQSSESRKRISCEDSLLDVQV